MPIQKFVIQYERDKPLFPINTFKFQVNPEFASENLKTLKGMLQILLCSLIFIPLDNQSLSQATSRCKRTGNQVVGSNPRSS